MEKEFVPYVEALELKELGFNEPCFTYYYNIVGKLRTNIPVNIGDSLTYESNKKSGITLAPTFSQAFRWFRSNGIESTIVPIILGTHKEYQFVIFALNEVLNTGFETYEKAELECLKKLIKIVKNKTK
jgi:hypothetical protein